MTAGTVLLVHGGWADPACWDDVEAALTERGHRVEAVELHRGSLAADTRAVQDRVDALGTPLTVCGWSYGGMVITGLGLAAGSELVYLAAFLPDIGESAAMLGSGSGSGIDRLIEPDAAGDLTLSGAELDDVLWADASPEQQVRARGWLRPQAGACYVGSAVRAAWREHPSTLVLGDADRAIDPGLFARLAQRAGTVLTWPTGHAALVSRPDLVAELLHQVSARVVARGE